MPTNSLKVNLYERRLLSRTAVKSNFLDFLTDEIDEQVSAIFQSRSGVLDGDVIGINPSGADEFDLDLTLANRVVVGTGQIIDLSQITGSSITTDIQFENESPVVYEVGVKFAEVEDGIELNPRTGDPEYPNFKQTYGEIDNPSTSPAPVNTQGSNLKLFIDTITEVGVDHTGRIVTVFLVNPVSSVLATAFFSGTSGFDGTNNFIDIPYSGAAGPLGQDTTVNPPSLVASDYKVFIEGVTWRRNQVLSTDSDYAFLGTVTGVGAGGTPAAGVTTGQKSIFIISLDSAYDGAIGSGDGRSMCVDSGAMIIKSQTSPGDNHNAQLQITRTTDTSESQIVLELFMSDADGGRRAIPIAVLAPVSTAGGEIQVAEPVDLDGTQTLTFNRGGSQDLTVASARLSDTMMLVELTGTTLDDGLFFVDVGTLAASTLDVIDTSTGAAPATWDNTDAGLVTIFRPIFWLSGSLPSTSQVTDLRGIVNICVDGRNADNPVRFFPEGNTSAVEIYDSQQPTRVKRTFANDKGVITGAGLIIKPDPFDVVDPTPETSFVYSLESPTATPQSQLHSARIGREVNAYGQEIRRFETHGRKADCHRFKDDFFYNLANFDTGAAAGAGPFSGTLNEFWSFNLSGTDAVGPFLQRIAAADPSIGFKPGGCAFMRTDDQAAARAIIFSQGFYEFRTAGPTDITRLHLYARIIPASTTGSVQYRVGFGTGSIPSMYFTIDTDLSNVWTLIAEDGGTVNSAALSFGTTLNAVHHIYITADPFPGTGRLIGTVSIEGGSTETTAVVPLATDGAGFIGRQNVQVEVITNNTTANDLFVDYIETWDELISSGADS